MLEKSVRVVQKKPLLVLLMMLSITSIIGYWNYIGIDNLYLFAGDVQSQFIPEIMGLLRVIREEGFPMWSFYRGLGQQVTVGNPNWTGDIFMILSVLLGGENFPYLFGLFAVVKIILSGIFFYCFLKEMGVAPFTRVAFSFFYAFNGHMILRGLWMHYATEVVFAALWLWALERYHNGKKLMFPIAFAVLLLSRNASYIFIYSGLSFFYVIVRECFAEGYSIKRIGKNIWKFIPYYATGIGLSAVLILPGIMAVFNSGRLSGENLFLTSPLTLTGILDIITAFLKSFSYSAFGVHFTTGVSGVILEDPVLYAGIFTALIFSQIFCFKNVPKREKHTLYGLLLLIAAYYLFPFIRYFLNAFSAPYYKTSSFWTIIFLILVSAYILHKIETGKETFKPVVLHITSALFLILFVAVYFYLGNQVVLKPLLFSAVLIVCINMIFAWKAGPMEKQILLIGLFCFEILAGLRMEIDDFAISEVQYFLKPEHKTIISQIKSELVEDHDFFRMEMDQQMGYELMNASQYYGYYGISSYASLQPSSMVNFYRLFEIEHPNDACLVGFGNRIGLQSLLGVRYFLKTNSASAVPEGFYFRSQVGDIELYENSNALPLGFLYDTYCLENNLDSCSNTEKDFTALSSLIVSTPLEGYSQYSPMDDSESKWQNVNVSLEDTVNVLLHENTFPQVVSYTSTNIDPMLVLRTTPAAEGGVYRITATIDSSEDTGGEIYFAPANGDFNGTQMLVFSLEKGEHEYSFEFQCEEPVCRVRFDIGDCPGEFAVKDFSLDYRKSAYPEQITARKEHSLQLTSFSHNHITGTVDSDRDRILFLSIPYDKGWKLRVDGVQETPIVGNGGFIACPIESGIHEIKLDYCTPGLRLGAAVSGISILAYAVLYIRKKKEVLL